MTTKATESGYHSAVTRRVPSVDPRLLAMTRGEIEPDDPFGGLEPAYEQMIPRRLLREDELVGFSDDPRHGFVLCQIDGRRSVSEIADACGLGLEQTFEILGDLAERGALDLV
ncbi:MAG TPA: hypothetical protein VIF62_28645 [Labilithrix sp.]